MVGKFLCKKYAQVYVITSLCLRWQIYKSGDYLIIWLYIDWKIVFIIIEKVEKYKEAPS